MKYRFEILPINLLSLKTVWNRNLRELVGIQTDKAYLNRYIRISSSNFCVISVSVVGRWIDWLDFATCVFIFMIILYCSTFASVKNFFVSFLRTVHSSRNKLLWMFSFSFTYTFWLKPHQMISNVMCFTTDRLLIKTLKLNVQSCENQAIKKGWRLEPRQKINKLLFVPHEYLSLEIV